MNRRKYTKEFLAKELIRFFNEHDKLPTQKDFENREGYPSRKTFINYFKTFNDALRYAGFSVVDKTNITKEFLISELKRYIDTHNNMPTSRIFDSKDNDYPSGSTYKKYFGSWNNALNEAGIKTSVRFYSDEELKSYFFKFVNENYRIPSILDFNCSEYPSFWCYQNRFGSWNKACEFYGFEPNKPKSGTIHYFNNGERCTSKYEYDVSNWLRKNNISYLRNAPYKDFINWYDGKRDCDYLIFHNGEFIFVEIAGLYSFKDNASSVEKSYIKRFNYKKEKLLPELNHKILYPIDFKKKTLDKMFSFLFEIKNPPWNIYQEVYRGVVDI